MHRVWAVLKKQLKQGSILFQLVVHPNQFHLLAGKLLVSFQRLLALSWTYILCLEQLVPVDQGFDTIGDLRSPGCHDPLEKKAAFLLAAGLGHKLQQRYTLPWWLPPDFQRTASWIVEWPTSRWYMETGILKGNFPTLGICQESHEPGSSKIFLCLEKLTTINWQNVQNI